RRVRTDVAFIDGNRARNLRPGRPCDPFHYLASRRLLARRVRRSQAHRHRRTRLWYPHEAAHAVSRARVVRAGSVGAPRRWPDLDGPRISELRRLLTRAAGTQWHSRTLYGW